MPGSQRLDDCEDCSHMLGPRMQGGAQLCEKCSDRAKEDLGKHLPDATDWGRGREVQGGLPGSGKRR